MSPLELFGSQNFRAIEEELFAAFAGALDVVLSLVTEGRAEDPEVLLAFYRWETADETPSWFWKAMHVQNAAVTAATVRQHIAATVPIAQAFGNNLLTVSSFQRRNEATGVLGGGVRICRDFLFVTTGDGIPEWAREMISVLAAVQLGFMSPVEARRIAFVSNNEHLIRHAFDKAGVEK